MPKIEGNLLKMKTELDSEVKYFLPVGEELIYMNELIGRPISFNYKGQINCIHCGRKTRTSFSQGYCYPCFQSLPQTDLCIMRPELCQAQDGISRDLEWAKNTCLQDHYVYLAVSSLLKVGVTRATQVPVRWIDQGAWKAIKLAKTPNRNLAGQIEVSLKQHLSDKTNWRHMLANKLAADINLLEEKERIKSLIPDDLKQYISNENEVTEINYPVIEYPIKVKSFGFEKVPQYRGILKGIKGQYLLFENSMVINMRKHAGYLVEVEY